MMDTKFDLVVFRDDFDRHVWCLAFQAAHEARRPNPIQLANTALRHYQADTKEEET
ncbi:Hypothetical protein I5071_9500 [Sandaracinus amylolyticus]|nr:Hypothetical protein I5071_9500 [Sandaracinus amylolyticus]